MQILFLAPFPPHKGGIAYYSIQFLRQAPKGLEIIPVGFKRIFPKFLYPGSSIKEKNMEKEEVPLIVDILNPFTWSSISKIELKEEGIFLIPYWTSILALPFYFIIKIFKKRKKKWKVLLWCHNIKDHNPLPLLELFKKNLFKLADGFLLHSNFALKEIEKEYSQKKFFSFLPLHPIDFDLIEKKIARKILNLNENEKAILFLGTIRKYKGIEDLIKIAEILKEKNYKFIIAGDLWRECKKYLRDLKKPYFKTYFGFHDFKRISLFLSSADLVLLPYKKASSSGILMLCYTYEVPFCIKYLEEYEEYLPLKYPVLKTPEEMANFIEKFFADKNYESFIRKIIKEKKDSFTWERFFENFFKFIENFF